MVSKSKSSRRWLDEHAKDPYVAKAAREGLRSRAVFKLAEIDRRDHLFRPGMAVVDLGAAPGGWSEYAASALHGSGRVWAVDCLKMDPIPGVEFIQGDFEDTDVLNQLLARVGGRRIDLVMSDMAPNMSGIRQVDQARAMGLAELALDFARQVLVDGGDLLVKVFHGEGFEAFLRELRAEFGVVRVRKPKASRPRSREVYFLARNYLL